MGNIKTSSACQPQVKSTTHGFAFRSLIAPSGLSKKAVEKSAFCSEIIYSQIWWPPQTSETIEWFSR